MHMKSTNAHWWGVPTVLLSTIKLPSDLDGCGWETAFMSEGGDWEILKRHVSSYDARVYHIAKTEQLGLKEI